MAELPQAKKKTPETALPEKKPFVALPPKPFVNNNPQFNKFWSKWKSGWGHPVIRKYAARSR